MQHPNKEVVEEMDIVSLCEPRNYGRKGTAVFDVGGKTRALACLAQKPTETAADFAAKAPAM